MSLDKIARRLLKKEDGNSLSAVMLYEFMIAILYKNSFGKLLAKPSCDRGLTWPLQRARMNVAIALLNSLDAKDSPRHSFSEKYREALRKTFFNNGGFGALPQKPSDNALEKLLAKRERRAAASLTCIDFSFRFQTVSFDHGSKGGITTAKNVLPEVDCSPWRHSRGSITNSWSTYRSTAPLLFLALRKGLLPRPKLTSDSFVDELLAINANKSALATFFSAYQQLVTELNKRGYKYETLTIGCRALPLTVEPLPADVIQILCQPKTSKKRSKTVL